MNPDEHRLTKVLVGAVMVFLLLTRQALAQPCGEDKVSG